MSWVSLTVLDDNLPAGKQLQLWNDLRLLSCWRILSDYSWCKDVKHQHSWGMALQNSQLLYKSLNNTQICLFFARLDRFNKVFYLVSGDPVSLLEDCWQEDTPTFWPLLPLSSARISERWIRSLLLFLTWPKKNVSQKKDEVYLRQETIQHGVAWVWRDIDWLPSRQLKFLSLLRSLFKKLYLQTNVFRTQKIRNSYQ